MDTLKIGDVVHGEKFVYDRWYFADGPVEKIVTEPHRTFVYINGDAYDLEDVTVDSKPQPRQKRTPVSTVRYENGVHDTDSGLGIGGINNDQSMPMIPSAAAIERLQRMHDTDTICRRCGASRNFDGAMFSTLAGSNICDDCA